MSNIFPSSSINGKHFTFFPLISLSNLTVICCIFELYFAETKFLLTRPDSRLTISVIFLPSKIDLLMSPSDIVPITLRFSLTINITPCSLIFIFFNISFSPLGSVIIYLSKFLTFFFFLKI